MIRHRELGFIADVQKYLSKFKIGSRLDIQIARTRHVSMHDTIWAVIHAKIHKKVTMKPIVETKKLHTEVTKPLTQSTNALSLSSAAVSSEPVKAMAPVVVKEKEEQLDWKNFVGSYKPYKDLVSVTNVANQSDKENYVKLHPPKAPNEHPPFPSQDKHKQHLNYSDKVNYVKLRPKDEQPFQDERKQHLKFEQIHWRYLKVGWHDDSNGDERAMDGRSYTSHDKPIRVSYPQHFPHPKLNVMKSDNMIFERRAFVTGISPIKTYLWVVDEANPKRSTMYILGEKNPLTMGQWIEGDFKKLYITHERRSQFICLENSWEVVDCPPDIDTKRSRDGDGFQMVVVRVNVSYSIEKNCMVNKYIGDIADPKWLVPRDAIDREMFSAVITLSRRHNSSHYDWTIERLDSANSPESL
ncbi:hypothetical protein PENTCL1PPCAC_18230 [Pristionchus entomophagus]|uniref:MSP domain-containing protein n=1 Tax=Pristionchus entomophagus TaxID=358040 RepID=A0AAV5TNT3_9BILA|nr:hypothetical protein PENTCL1PPCAC_18230 [Pristionchus entomophagus]